MKTLLLVRHGQASFGAEDYDNLSALGHEQSALLGSHLTQKFDSFDAIFSGDMKRHAQTLSAALGCEATTVDANWNEFDHKAVFRYAMIERSLSREDLPKLSDEEKIQIFAEGLNAWAQTDKPTLAFDESWRMFTNRVMDALDHAIEQTENTGIVFTSGGVISVILGQLWQLPTESVLRLNWTMTNTGISKLLVSKRGVTVSTFNEHHHLEHTQNKKFITYK